MGTEKRTGSRIHDAIANNNSKDVKSILSKARTAGTDSLNKVLLEKNEDGLFPMEAAVAQGTSEEIVRLLLKAGTPVTLAGKDGDSMLHLASCKGHSALVELLLSQAADAAPDLVNAPSQVDGETPLMAAAKLGHLDTVQSLLSNPHIDINAIHKGDDARSASETALMKALLSEKVEVALALIEHGADVNLPDGTSAAPLHRAAWLGSLVVVQALISEGANVLYSDRKGLTALDKARLNGHHGIVSLLESASTLHSQVYDRAQAQDFGAIVRLTKEIQGLGRASDMSIDSDTVGRPHPLTPGKESSSVNRHLSISPGHLTPTGRWSPSPRVSMAPADVRRLSKEAEELLSARAARAGGGGMQSPSARGRVHHVKAQLHELSSLERARDAPVALGDTHVPVRELHDKLSALQRQSEAMDSKITAMSKDGDGNPESLVKDRNAIRRKQIKLLRKVDHELRDRVKVSMKLVKSVDRLVNEIDVADKSKYPNMEIPTSVDAMESNIEATLSSHRSDTTISRQRVEAAIANLVSALKTEAASLSATSAFHAIDAKVYFFINEFRERAKDVADSLDRELGQIRGQRETLANIAKGFDTAQSLPSEIQAAERECKLADINFRQTQLDAERASVDGLSGDMVQRKRDESASAARVLQQRHIALQQLQAKRAKLSVNYPELNVSAGPVEDEKRDGLPVRLLRTPQYTTRSLKMYEVLEKLGASERVYKVRFGDSIRVLKAFHGSQRNALIKELGVLCFHSHPCIVPITAFFEDNGMWYVEMPYYDTSIIDWLQRPNVEYDRREIARKILLALQYLHHRNILHCDIKLDNIVIDIRRDIATPVLLDFDVSHHDNALTITRSSGPRGTHGYIAPEVLEGKQPTQASDMYAFGVTLFKMFTRSDADVIVDGRRVRYDTDLLGSNADLETLLSSLLAPVPEHRLCAFEVIMTPFFSASQVKKLEAQGQVRVPGEALHLAEQRLASYKLSLRIEDRPTVPIAVNRRSLVADVLAAFSQHQTPTNLRDRLVVTFETEDGMDLGGLTREMYTKFFQALYEGELGLFEKPEGGRFILPARRDKNGRTARGEKAPPTKLYRLIGRIMVKSLFDTGGIAPIFPLSFFKYLRFGLAPLQWSDIETFDSVEYKSLIALKSAGTSVDSLGLEFEPGAGIPGLPETLSPDQFTVTQATLPRFLNQRLHTVLLAGRIDALDAIRKGVLKCIDEFMPGEWDRMPPSEVMSFLCHTDTIITAKEIIDRLHFAGFSDAQTLSVAQEFATTLWQWERTEPRRLVLFLEIVTGAPILPPDQAPILVTRSGDVDRLPVAHTCAFQLDLPAYEPMSLLGERLETFMKHAGESGFGLV